MQRVCECKNGSSITSDFMVISIPKYCILVCLKQLSVRRRALFKNLNPFTSNYPVISLPDFLRDKMRELNETYNIDRGDFESANFCFFHCHFGGYVSCIYMFTSKSK